MITDKKIIVFILLFTGVFLFNMPFEDSSCITPQLVYLLFSVGVLGYLCMRKVNKYMAFLFLVAVLMACRSYIGERGSRFYMLDEIVIGSAMFGVYYFTRILNIKENMLKWIMVPALINCLFVFTQKFGLSINPIPNVIIIPSGITGIISNGGFTSCFLAATVPIFYKHFKWGLIPLFLAIIFCNGFVGVVAGLICLSTMMFFDKKKIISKIILPVFIISVILSGFFLIKHDKLMVRRVDFNQRMSMYLGTLDGIMYHPVNGWGVGTFQSIMARVKPDKSAYFRGVRFNDGTVFMNHPHNELLFWWWNFGIFFIVGIFFLIRDYCKKICNNMMSTFILLTIFISILGYQMMSPLLFLMMFTMGVFENEYYLKKED